MLSVRGHKILARGHKWPFLLVVLDTFNNISGTTAIIKKINAILTSEAPQFICASNIYGAHLIYIFRCWFIITYNLVLVKHGCPSVKSHYTIRKRRRLGLGLGDGNCSCSARHSDPMANS